MDNHYFAAFIMTFERPRILLCSIEKLIAQKFPPEVILIIDNSSSLETEIIIQQTYGNNKKIVYHRVGYNSGPAGAAKIGLEKLSNLGYRWIYWGDDDNPPRDTFVFEQMFNRIKYIEETNVKIGIIGGKGALFNKLTGVVTSLKNADLKNKEVAEVDYVAGGQTMIVNSEVIKSGILPQEKLFFSFEDLDFCLEVKNNGFKVFVDAKTWYKIRKAYNNVADNYRHKGSSFGKSDKVLRDYYSTRSILYILFKNRLIVALAFQLFKSIFKMLLGYKYGLNYGERNFKFQKRAIIDFFQNNYNYNEVPYKEKYII